MTKTLLKVAVVGVGAWGYQHARIFASHKDARLCAIVGRNKDKTERRAGRFGATAYVSLDEMLVKERPDLVSLCLPDDSHFEASLQVISAGIPLLVEKPLVYELEQADRLLDEAAKRGLFFAINFNHRFARPVQLAFAAKQAGRLGNIVFASWRFGGEGRGLGRHPHANLIETQCHGFDMLEYLAGPIDNVAVQMSDVTGQGFSTLAIALHFASGGVGSIVGSYDSSYAYQGTQHLELNGVLGRVTIDDTVARYAFQSAGNETAEVWRAGYFNDYDREFMRTFDRHVDALLVALREGQPPPIPASAGRRALELAHACIRSFETGCRVAT